MAEQKKQLINRNTYRLIKRMDHSQLSEYITNVYLKGYEAGRKAATPELLMRTFREVLLSIDSIGPTRADAIMKKLSDTFAIKEKEAAPEENSGAAEETTQPDEDLPRYQPKVVRGKVHDTGLPIDGCELLLSSWEYDHHESWHLYGWDDAVDEAVMRTMHQTDGLYSDEPLEAFAELWKAKEYEPGGAFCLELDKVDVIELLQEEVT